MLYQYSILFFVEEGGRGWGMGVRIKPPDTSKLSEIPVLADIHFSSCKNASENKREVYRKGRNFREILLKSKRIVLKFLFTETFCVTHAQGVKSNKKFGNFVVYFIYERLF